MGLRKYIQTNLEITNCVSELLRSSNDSKSVAISSGAATIFEKNKKSIEDDPYGFLKLNEENKLAEVSECMKLRIYGLTGKFISNPELFALGSFLFSAINNKQIEIKSRCPVIRSYGFASDIARFGLSWLNSNDGSDSFYAATETIALDQLADKITKMFNLNSVKHQIDFKLPANKYICETDNFKKKLSKYKIQITPMEDQIFETYKYLKKKYAN